MYQFQLMFTSLSPKPYMSSHVLQICARHSFISSSHLTNMYFSPRPFPAIATILLLLLSLSPQNPNALTVQPIIHHTQPPLLCTAEKSIAIGRCTCFLTITRAIKLVNRRVGVERCLLIFDSKTRILTFETTCNSLKRKGVLNIRKLIRRANKIVKVCIPGQPKIVLAQ